jgi:alpha-tubulin suppressor-like RCC1 family protein/uncharacterized membrane protein YgcG
MAGSDLRFKVWAVVLATVVIAAAAVGASAGVAAGAPWGRSAARHRTSMTRHGSRLHGRHGHRKQRRNAAHPRSGVRQPGPCYAAFPDARSKTIGKTTWYNRQESVRMVLCYGFGLEPSADFPISASMTCGLLAQVIGSQAEQLGLFADGACSGADLASDPTEPTKYIGAACAWASDILGALAKPAGVLASLGCALAPSIGHSLGGLFESKHEFDVAVDVVEHGECIKYSPTHFGSPWVVDKCKPGDPGFSDLPLASTGGEGGNSRGAGGGSGGSGGSGGGGSGGGGTGSGGGGTGGGGAKQIAAGDYHSCALLASGGVDCWGLNGDGQLGNGTTNESHVPGAVSGITDGTAVSVSGSYDSCAVLASGSVDCWGANPTGNLGDGTSTGPETCAQDGFGGLPCSPLPVVVNGITGAVAVSTGANHTCAVLKSGGVDCWGESVFGALGNGTTIGTDNCGSGIENCHTSPVAVNGITNATAISSGAGDSCVVLATGAVECWGSNSNGQLGDGTNTGPEGCNPAGYCSTTPVSVSGITNATAVSTAEGFYSCAALASGVDCWGDNSFGELGNGSNTGPEDCGNDPCSRTPVPVSGITSATAVSTNYDHACALLATGSVECWGVNNSGDLGSNAGDSNVPVPVPGINDATAVAAGGAYSCALLATGSVDCWGTNKYGQLGDGTTIDSATPVQVTGIP